MSHGGNCLGPALHLQSGACVAHAWATWAGETSCAARACVAAWTQQGGVRLAQPTAAIFFYSLTAASQL